VPYNNDTALYSGSYELIQEGDTIGVFGMVTYNFELEEYSI